jgi:hypothetical protein
VAETGGAMADRTGMRRRKRRTGVEASTVALVETAGAQRRENVLFL